MIASAVRFTTQARSGRDVRSRQHRATRRALAKRGRPCPGSGIRRISFGDSAGNQKSGGNRRDGGI